MMHDADRRGADQADALVLRGEAAQLDQPVVAGDHGLARKVERRLEGVEGERDRAAGDGDGKAGAELARDRAVRRSRA